MKLVNAGELIEQITDMMTPTRNYRHKFCGEVEETHCVQYDDCEDCIAKRIKKLIKDKMEEENV